MFTSEKRAKFRKGLDGVRFKSLAHGEKTHLCVFHLDKGAVIPAHKHPHEQTGYQVSGRMKFLLGKKAFVVEPGSSWTIAGNVEHGVKALEDCVVIEVFSPRRKDYLDRTSRRRKEAHEI